MRQGGTGTSRSPRMSDGKTAVVGHDDGPESTAGLSALPTTIWETSSGAARGATARTASRPPDEEAGQHIAEAEPAAPAIPVTRGLWQPAFDLQTEEAQTSTSETWTNRFSRIDR